MSGVVCFDDDVGRLVLGKSPGKAQKILEKWDIGVEKFVLVGGDIQFPRREDRAQGDDDASHDQHAQRMLHDVKNKDQKWAVDRRMGSGFRIGKILGHALAV